MNFFEDFAYSFDHKLFLDLHFKFLSCVLYVCVCVCVSIHLLKLVIEKTIMHL